MNNIYVELTKLESELKSAKKGLGGQVKINQAQCMESIAAIKRSLPVEINEAKAVLSQRDAILKKAEDYTEETQKYCLKLVREAQEKADKLVQDSEILRKAKIEASKKMKEAEEFCTNVRKATLNHVDSMLNKAENDLTNILNNVRSAREELRGELIK